MRLQHFALSAVYAETQNIDDGDGDAGDDSWFGEYVGIALG